MTERDEHAYQEMITHIPMHAHPDPQSVLIVGGGDGGVLREVCRHERVQKITMCEIDPVVCEVSKKYLGKTLATSFDDPRLNLVHADAAEFVKDKLGEYDVIIVDSSDPVGPAESLFTSSFYTGLKAHCSPLLPIQNKSPTSPPPPPLPLVIATPLTRRPLPQPAAHPSPPPPHPHPPGCDEAWRHHV